MRVAVTAWEDRVSPVLDSARILLIADVEGEQIVDRFYEPVSPGVISRTLESLRKHNVATMICGAASEESIALLENSGIELFPFVTGKIDTILNRFIKGEELEIFAMPGCWCQCPRCPKLQDRQPGQK